MDVVIVKYSGGNIRSVVNALNRLGVEPRLTDDARHIASADKVIFPGQGAAGNVMNSLREKGLDEVICTLKQPVLGICIGQQLMCRYSEEGDTDCLGIFDVPVCRFSDSSSRYKVPHMGWNSLYGLSSPLFRGLKEHSSVYFIHSYYIPVCAFTIATCDYILPFSAALNKDNFYATQFHPEKSGDVGERILENFLSL